MTEGIEEHNWAKANEKYKDVQNAIVSGKQFELYADCQRLIPADIKPVSHKMELEIEAFDPEKMGIGNRRAASNAKRKREETDSLDLFAAGFQKASDGLKKPVKASKAQKEADLPEEVEEFPLGRLGTSSLTAAEADEVARRKEQPSLQAAQSARTRTAAFPRPLPKANLFSDPATQRRTFRTSSYRREAVTNILEQGARHAADAGAFEKWESKLRSDLRWEFVNQWKYSDAGEEHAGRGKDKSFLGSNFRIPEEDRQSSLSAFRNRDAAAAPPAAKKIKGADLLFSDDDDNLPELPGGPVNKDDSDEELPDLAAAAFLPQNFKKTGRAKAPRPPLKTLPLARKKTPKTEEKPRILEKPSSIRSSYRSNGAAKATVTGFIEIDSDDDPSVMIVDKPFAAQ